MSDNAKHKHIFIAYASQDQAAHDTFLSHLNVLKKEIPIIIWSKVNLLGGDEISKETQNELRQADLIVLLVSADALNSEAYMNIQSKVQTSATFVPVLLRPCMWKSDPFLKDLQALPKNEKSISEANNPDKVYTAIVGEIKKILVGKAEDTPPAVPKPKSSFRKTAVLAALVAVLALIGIRWFSSSFNDEDKLPNATSINDTPNVVTTPILDYGTPIFTTNTSLFKILIIRFEDNLNEYDSTYCIGRSIEENFIQLKEKGLPIHSVYADSIVSPKYSEEAERIQKHHNADVLIYGRANEIQENCAAANVCFRHIVANTIMANLGISEDVQRIKHDTKYERISHSEIEKGKLSVDEQSMEAWVTGLVALKRDDKGAYLAEIEKMAEDIAHLTKEEQASKFYYQANTYRYSGDYKKAIASYNKAIELNPDYTEAYNNRGTTYWYLKDYKRAILDYDKAIELNPDYADAYNNRGTTYASLKDYKRAILDYDKAIELNPDDADVYYNRGTAYADLEDYKRAILDYDKAIELNPDFAEAHNNRGNTYDDLKDYKRAILNYDKAIELKPDYATTYYNRGCTYASLKDYKRAILNYDKAIELKPNDGSAYSNRGNSYWHLKEYKRSISDHNKAIELNPDYALFHINRARTYIYSGHYEKAIIDSKKAIKLNPKDSYGYFNLIAAYALKNLILIIFSLIFIIALFLGWRRYRISKK